MEYIYCLLPDIEVVVVHNLMALLAVELVWLHRMLWVVVHNLLQEEGHQPTMKLKIIFTCIGV